VITKLKSTNKLNLLARPLSEELRLVLSVPEIISFELGKTFGKVPQINYLKNKQHIEEMRITLAPGVHQTWIQLFVVPAGSSLEIYHQVEVAAGATWQHLIGVVGEGQVNIRREVSAVNAGSQINLAALGAGRGTAQLSVADEIFVTAPEITSHLQTKVVLANQARCLSRGRIVVSDQALGSVVQENLDCLLLDNQTWVRAIPELEVATPKVKAKHGATVAPLDASAKWFLQSQGLDAKQADQLLIKGFLATAIKDFNLSNSLWNEFLTYA
jgi:Fe-S cluster assembly scaffold protein SufB